MSLRNLFHWLRQLVSWLIAPAIIVVVFGELTHIPVLQDMDIDVWDKALHFTAYFGLSLMTTIAVRADRRSIWLALALVVMGGGLEILQGMTGRDADINDEFANTLGVLTGWALVWSGIAFLIARGILHDKEP